MGGAGEWGGAPHTMVLLPSNTGLRLVKLSSAHEMGGTTMETAPSGETPSTPFAAAVFPPLLGIVFMDGEPASVPASLGGGACCKNIVKREIIHYPFTLQPMPQANNVKQSKLEEQYKSTTHNAPARTAST